MPEPAPGPVTYRELIALALPASASALLNNAFRLIDQHAAGSIDTPSQAAIGSCTFVLIATYAVHDLAAAGAAPLVGRATGAQDPAARRAVIGQAILLGLAAGIGLALPLALLAPQVAAALGLAGETAHAASVFLQTLCLFAPGLCLFPLIDACFVAMGLSRWMMGLQIAAALLNALLNPLLIHGVVLGGAPLSPPLGVAGAAAATGVSRCLCVALGLALLARATGLRRSDLAWGDQIARVARIGLPISANILFYALVYWALLRVAISPLGPEVNAALGIGFSALEGVSYPCYLGVSLALSSVVARRLGAGQPDQARRAAALALPLSLGLGAAVTAAFALLPRALCAPFTHDPAVLALAVGYAQALAFSQIAVAVEAWAEGVLMGAGATRTVLRWSAPLNLLRVPLGWLLAIHLGWGAAGVWWAINLSSFVKAAGKGAAARRGAWTQTRV